MNKTVPDKETDAVGCDNKQRGWPVRVHWKSFDPLRPYPLDNVDKCVPNDDIAYDLLTYVQSEGVCCILSSEIR